MKTPLPVYFRNSSDTPLGTLSHKSKAISTPIVRIATKNTMSHASVVGCSPLKTMLATRSSTFALMANRMALPKLPSLSSKSHFVGKINKVSHFLTEAGEMSECLECLKGDLRVFDILIKNLKETIKNKSD